MIGFLTGRLGRYAMFALAIGVAALWWDRKAYNRGYAAHAEKVAAATRALNERLDAADERARVAEAHRARLEQERNALERELADEASRLPVAGDPGLHPDIMRTIDAIR